MPTYETLDTIADSVIPALIGVTLVFPAVPPVRARTGLLCWYVPLIATLIGVYALMFIDWQLALWPAFGADYSTHTAVATALVMLWSRAGRPVFLSGIAVLVAYGALMLYQGYHTVLDMVTTACVITALSIGILRLTDRYPPRTAFDT